MSSDSCMPLTRHNFFFVFLFFTKATSPFSKFRSFLRSYCKCIGSRANASVPQPIRRSRERWDSPRRRDYLPTRRIQEPPPAFLSHASSDACLPCSRQSKDRRGGEKGATKISGSAVSTNLKQSPEKGRRWKAGADRVAPTVGFLAERPSGPLRPPALSFGNSS